MDTKGLLFSETGQQIGMDGQPAIRYAVLPLSRGWVIYDRQTQRIVDGVYYRLSLALAVCYGNNTDVPVRPNMTPGPAALKLIAPSWERAPEEAEED